MKKATRRDSLKYVAASVCGGGLLSAAAQNHVPNSKKLTPKSVAAVITEYTKGTHADVLIGKLLEGWRQDGGPGPALQLASLYVDQFPRRDLARKLAARYKVPLFDTIAKALTLGSDRIGVDGVISVGEHGNYPWNKLQQHLYP